MTAFIRKAVSVPYLWPGIVALCVAVLILIIEPRDLLLWWQPGFGWQVTTGALLFLALCFQWILLLVRIFGQTEAIRRHMGLHRWVGIASVVLFAAHAARAGYGWTSALSTIFLLSALSGLLNKEVVTYRARWHYLCWLAIHLVFAAILVPLVLVHIWVALAYQGAG